MILALIKRKLILEPLHAHDSVLYSKPYSKKIDALKMPRGYQPPKFMKLVVRWRALTASFVVRKKWHLLGLSDWCTDLLV